MRVLRSWENRLDRYLTLGLCKELCRVQRHWGAIYELALTAVMYN